MSVHGNDRMAIILGLACCHRGEDVTEALAGWPTVKVATAEASGIGIALSSLKETALSLGRPITGSGVSRKLACLCTGVKNQLMRLRIDVHESPAAHLPRLCWVHGITPQLSVYIKRWPKAISWTMIMGHRFQHIYSL